MRPPTPPRSRHREPGPATPRDAASPERAGGTAREAASLGRDDVTPAASPGRDAASGQSDAASSERDDGQPGEPVPRTLAGAPRQRALRRRDAPVMGQRPGLVERQGERARAQRRLAWRRVLIGLAVLAVLAGIGWVVLGSAVLALEAEDVTVHGAGEGTTVSQAEVMAVAQPHVGTPLARLDTAALAAQVTQITTVRTAAVHRAWPTGLEIEVAPREPVAAARSEDGTVLLDVEGVVVGVAEEVPEDVPLVTVPLTGDRVGQNLEAVLTVLAGLPETLRADVATAGASSPASITLELTDGAEVKWGGVAESELKTAVLEVLREREAEVYDVTVPRTPTAATPTPTPTPTTSSDATRLPMSLP